MLQDIFCLPDQGIGDVKIFQPNSVSGTAVFSIWRKPKGCTLVSMTLIGGGGGGGNGFTRTSGSAGGGGGGGGSAAISRLFIPALFLPDVLYVSVGWGGAAATAGVASYISLEPTTSNVLILSANAGGAATSGTGSAVGAAGGAGAALAAPLTLGFMGLFNASAGLAGAAGGAIAGGVGASITWGGTSYLTGGAGGGGSTSGDFSGGNITGLSAPGYTPTVSSLGAFSAGQSGVQVLNSFMFTGAAGGGTANTGGAGSGGGGNVGCGGGGGGAGTTGGAGGKGGSGIAVLVSV